MIIIYTGNGKGKTSAALGLILRASGYNKKILVVQFIKTWFTGEKKALEKFPNVQFYQMGKGFVGILNDNLPKEEHQKAAEKALNFVSEKIQTDEFDIVILDEINVAIREKLISSKRVVEVLNLKNPSIDIVLTGRNAPQELVDLADLVTEMKEIKHPYQKGIKAKAGIDF